jgi:D-3-phosphoglycerate dehydrogenase
MHVVISDDYQDCVRTLHAFSLLATHSVDVHRDTLKDLDGLAERFANADAIVLIRERTAIDDALLARLPTLRLIAQTGKVSGHIDLAACTRRGIEVTESSGAGGATVELTMLLALASLRNLVDEANHLRAGGWQRSLGRQLAGRTFGVFGFGRIGTQVARLAHSFGARVLVYGRSGSCERARTAGYEVAASRAQFFSTSELLSLHLRLTPESRATITAADLASMRPDAILINTSRAELVEPGALVDALDRGRPGFAAVDVFEEEPVLAGAHPLLSRKNCLCTPHLGFVERDNYEAYFRAAFESVNTFASRLAPPDA